MAKKRRYLYDFKDKERNVQYYCNQMLNRLCQFTTWNLPDTIDTVMLEKRLLPAGDLVLTEIKEDEIVKLGGPDDIDIKPGLYAFEAGPAGVVDFNDNMTFAVIAHPRLKAAKTVQFGVDAVLLRNDTFMMGVMPIFRRYATQLVENDITMNMADIESRIISLIVAGDSNAINSAKTFLDEIEKGNLGVIADKGFDELFQMKTLPYTTTANNSLTNLIEYQQYVKASWYNELGLDANYNMKRESINSDEAQMGNESLLPLIDDMLYWRKKACEELKTVFGIEASVELNSGWKELREEAESSPESESDVEEGEAAEVEEENNED